MCQNIHWDEKQPANENDKKKATNSRRCREEESVAFSNCDDTTLDGRANDRLLRRKTVGLETKNTPPSSPHTHKKVGTTPP